MGEAFPYPSASDDAIRAGAWTADLGSSQGGLPEWLPDWDLSRQVEVRRRIEVDRAMLRRDTGVDDSASFAFAITFDSTFDDVAHVVPLDTSDEVASVDLAAV